MKNRIKSTEYVKGNTYASGWRTSGRALTGMKMPQRKIIGKRKKFAKVIASNISFTATETKVPNAEKTKAESTNDVSKNIVFEKETPKKITVPIRNILDIRNPKTTPPITFPNKIACRDNGASSNRSNVFVLRSKTMTIASADVEANRIDIAINPDAKSITPEGFRKMKASAITMGNIIPQLRLGGLK
jgi:hypothetical protein